AICVCKELGVKDNPRNSTCIDGARFIPIQLIDLPGLIKGSWEGKGLGTQFLSVASQADALIHIADASGSVDADGKITKPGMGNPIADVYDIEEEIVRWFAKSIEKTLRKVKKPSKKGSALDRAFAQDLAGMKITPAHITRALEAGKLAEKELGQWKRDDVWNFAKNVRAASKPTLIVANKMDLAVGEKNYEKLIKEFGQAFVIPASSDAELALRRAEQAGYVEYVPGEETFKVKDRSKLSQDQREALAYVEQRVFSKWIRTGVQFALNTTVFKLLGMNAVYPVEDEVKFADGKGNVLPDTFLVPYNASMSDLAAEIHSDLAKTMIYAVDARTKIRLPTDYKLKDRDVVKIVAAAKGKAAS
ncbi:MAG TPA: YchF-related putative GTPase, partial [Candidatus Dormibacteraeota bacterium]|nr:YchF-related putative GTPase [Candidatus Dormibacteraeota bacterium]